MTSQATTERFTRVKSHRILILAGFILILGFMFKILPSIADIERKSIGGLSFIGLGGALTFLSIFIGSQLFRFANTNQVGIRWCWRKRIPWSAIKEIKFYDYSKRGRLVRIWYTHSVEEIRELEIPLRLLKNADRLVEILRERRPKTDAVVSGVS